MLHRCHFGALRWVAILLAIVLVIPSCKKKDEAASPPAVQSPAQSEAVQVSTWKPELPAFVPQPDPAATVVTAVDPKSVTKADLPDGASVLIPPGATTRPTSLKMSRLLNSPVAMGVNGLGSSVYEVALDEGADQPRQAVQVTIPLSKEMGSQGVTANKLAVAHWDGSMWRPIAARIDLEKGIAETSVSHFSSFAVVSTDRYEAGPGRIYLNPPSMGDFTDRRVPRGAMAECVIFAGPGASYDTVWINGVEIVDSSGQYKPGVGVVRRVPVGALTECRFNIRIAPDAKIGPYDIDLYGKNEGRQRYPGYLVVSSPMVMIIDIDGMRQSVFNNALIDPPKLYVTIPRLFSGLGSDAAKRSPNVHKAGNGLSWEQFRSGVALNETTTIFPSVTFAGHAAIFSGNDLGGIRMAGNEWFDRRVPRKFGFTIDLQDTRGSYDGQDWGPVKFGGKGLANERMHQSGIKTVYEMVHDQFNYRSVVFHNMYYEGAEWQPYSWLRDEAFYYFCPFSTFAEWNMTKKANKVIARADQDLGVMTLYYAGADHHGHERYSPKDLGERQKIYLTGFPLEYPGSGLMTLPPGADISVSIDTNLGQILSNLTDVMYKETTYVFTADHGQSGMSFPRDGVDEATARIHCFARPRSNKTLHKLSDLVFEAGFLPYGTYDLGDDSTKSLAAPDATAMVGCNGGMAQIYLRRPKPETSLAPENVARKITADELDHAADGYETWDRPARFQDVLRVAAKLAELRVGAPLPVEDYANSIDQILVRNTEQATGDWMRPDYLLYLSPTEQVPVIDYLKSPAGRAWMTAKHMGYRGDDRDAAMIADRIQRLQSFVSGDLLVLPHYPDFYFEYDPLDGDHGSITRLDMEIPFAVARPCLSKPDWIVKGLQKAIDLDTKNRPANTDVRAATLEFLKREPFAPSPDTDGGLEIIATKQNQTMTMVEFTSKQLQFMKKDNLRFRLYRGVTANGPWEFVGGIYGKGAKGNNFTSPVELTPQGTIVIGDSASVGSHDPQPPFYRAAQVLAGPELAEPEVYSAPYAPPEPVIQLRGPRTSDFDPPLGDIYSPDAAEPSFSDEFERGMFLDLIASMNVPDSSFRYPGAHFTITWGDRTWHAWSGRQVKGETYGNEGTARIALPTKFGTHELLMHAEGAGGGAADTTITIKYEPAWAAKRVAAAAKTIDDQPNVKNYLPRGEEAPAKVAKLEKELAAETNDAHKGELREAIIQLQELALNLEDARLTALLSLAKASAAATDGGQAMDRMNIWAENYRGWADRYNAWVDRAIEWDLVYHGSDGKERNERYRKTMSDNTKFVWISGLEQGLTFATRFGDYSSGRLFGLRLLAALDTVSNHRAPSGNDVEWVKNRLAAAVADLAGNRAAAARLVPESSRPAWWPDSGAATEPANNDTELKSLEKDLAKRTADTQAKQKVHIKPGVE